MKNYEITPNISNWIKSVTIKKLDKMTSFDVYE